MASIVNWRFDIVTTCSQKSRKDRVLVVLAATRSYESLIACVQVDNDDGGYPAGASSKKGRLLVQGGVTSFIEVFSEGKVIGEGSSLGTTRTVRQVSMEHVF